MVDYVPSYRLIAPPVREQEVGYSAMKRTRVMNPKAADGSSSGTAPNLIRLNGLLTGIITSAPNIPTDTTFTVSLINEDGITEFTSGNIADNGKLITNVVSSNAYLCGNYQVKVTFATALSGNTAEFDVQFLLLVT